MENIMNEPAEQIRVLLVKPNEEAKEMIISSELEDMQYLVRGYIQMYSPFPEEVAIICNEEGKLNGLPLNRAIRGAEGEIIDIIAGDFFICSAPIESESFQSLSDEQMKRYKEKFQYPDRFIRTDYGVEVIPGKAKTKEQER